MLVCGSHWCVVTRVSRDGVSERDWDSAERARLEAASKCSLHLQLLYYCTAL